MTRRRWIGAGVVFAALIGTAVVIPVLRSRGPGHVLVGSEDTAKWATYQQRGDSWSMA